MSYTAEAERLFNQLRLLGCEDRHLKAIWYHAIAQRAPNSETLDAALVLVAQGRTPDQVAAMAMHLGGGTPNLINCAYGLHPYAGYQVFDMCADTLSYERKLLLIAVAHLVQTAIDEGLAIARSLGWRPRKTAK